MPTLVPLTRRRFLKRALAATLLGGGTTSAYAWRIEPHWVEVVRRDLPIARLPDRLAGRTLVQLSDLHVGPEVADSYLKDALKRVSALEPDLVVLTGDFVTCVRGEQVERAARVLSHLKPPRLGAFAALGNHDYGSCYGLRKVADRLTRRLRDLGIDVLRNDRREVHGLTVAGIDDYWGPNYCPTKVLATLSHDRANLVLCHNPDVADEPVWDGYRGWILCGHTHGGQCKPPLLAPPLLPVKNKRYVAGEIDLFDGRRLYVNRGLGHLLRARFNVRPEVTVFTLRRAG